MNFMRDCMQRKHSLALMDSIGRLVTPCGRFLDRHFLSSFGIWFNFLWITWMCLFMFKQRHILACQIPCMQEVFQIENLGLRECLNNPLKICFGSERFVACQTVLFSWLFLIDQIIIYSLKWAVTKLSMISIISSVITFKTLRQ